MHVSVGYSRRNWRCNQNVTQSLTQLHVARIDNTLSSDKDVDVMTDPETTVRDQEKGVLHIMNDYNHVFGDF